MHCINTQRWTYDIGGLLADSSLPWHSAIWLCYLSSSLSSVPSLGHHWAILKHLPQLLWRLANLRYPLRGPTLLLAPSQACCSQRSSMHTSPRGPKQQMWAAVYHHRASFADLAPHTDASE
ncbi:hypothetical protein CBOM_03477 [Ceraceosorus bombacis]|uniref:Uncharacterized protein n=1 Tax=Ceraceosorus bombacis TaxID=401625 RepID=A0A0P1BN81_9BASI|nr:hypothetical protein CBOM_03477 [Ceraceosorus bombacis]